MLAAVQDTHRVPRAPPATIHTIQDKSTRGKEGKVRERERRKAHARRLATPPTRVYPQPPHLPTARATKPAAKASPGVQAEAPGSQRLLVPGALLRRGPSPTPPPGPVTRAQGPQPAHTLGSPPPVKVNSAVTPHPRGRHPRPPPATGAPPHRQENRRSTHDAPRDRGVQRVQHTHTKGQIRCRSYNSGRHWAGGGQRAGWFLRVTRAWGVTSQRPVWCGDGPARPPQPGPSRYVLHQLRSPRRNGAKRPAHLITPPRTCGAHITQHGTRASRSPRVAHAPRTPSVTGCTSSDPIMAQRLPDKAP